MNDPIATEMHNVLNEKQISRGKKFYRISLALVIFAGLVGIGMLVLGLSLVFTGRPLLGSLDISLAALNGWNAFRSFTHYRTIKKDVDNLMSEANAVG